MQLVPNLNEARHYIYNKLDLTMVIHKMTHASYQGEVWSLKDARYGATLYRNFLYLCKKYKPRGHKIVPSEEIDEFWHNHILDTRKYHKDCMKIFGAYQHHYPYFGMDKKSTLKDLNRLFDVTQELYFKEFGEYL